MMQPKPCEYFKVFISCFEILQNQLQVHDDCHCQAQPQLNSTQSQLKLLSLALLNSSLLETIVSLSNLGAPQTKLVKPKGGEHQGG